MAWYDDVMLAPPVMQPLMVSPAGQPIQVSARWGTYGQGRCTQYIMMHVVHHGVQWFVSSCDPQPGAEQRELCGSY